MIRHENNEDTIKNYYEPKYQDVLEELINLAHFHDSFHSFHGLSNEISDSNTFHV